MIKSMTAFGRAKLELENKDITVELHSVNSRYFDATVKAPRAYLPLEERIKTYVQKNAVSRAKADIFISVKEHGAKVNAFKLDTEAARQYISALCQLRDTFNLKDDISTMSVARNPDVFSIKMEDEDVEELWKELLPALDGAISGYSQMRESEGKKTEEDIKEKMEIFYSLRNRVAEISKSEIVGFRDKFEQRIRALLSDTETVVDENRILAECSIYADKVAIDEELARLESHRESFYKILSSDEPAGRKLDFLMQEFNRETNTIGSKANNVNIAALVVNMKSELEKIREQVQNIE